MSTQSYKKQDAYSLSSSPDKMAVFQECLQQFNATPVNAKKCRQLLAKLLRLLYNGESFPSQESTTLFFSISKLFQHKDQSLRQIVYLTIKELSQTSDDILMVTSSIMKDIQGNDAVYKPNAIRTLSKVLDPTTVTAAERLFKNLIVDKNPIISSAALISSYNLLPHAKDIVKRFSNEVLESIQSFKQFNSHQFELHEYYGSATSNLPSTSYMYQYHALGLIYQLRNHDKMALMKLITSLSEGVLKNSLSIIQLIRFINKLLIDDNSLQLLPIIINFLKHKSDMVELEACKTLINLQNLLTDEQEMMVIGTLQKLLSVPRTATRFAAIRLINKISIKHPEKIMVCNLELENLINDSNKSISTIAITTLLKTSGTGSIETTGEGVDRLITKMTSLMEDISDDFKMVIIEAIENLALRYPTKVKKLVGFLTDLLRDDGSLELKSTIVDALFDLIKFLSDDSSKQLILMNLCEFIEDCEFTELSVRILHLLGDQGPTTSNVSYYIRHIYNRLVLENSIIRSSAVISLAKFAAVCGGIVSKNIIILLSRCLNDVDDEVRDRAAISLNFINHHKKNLIVNDSKYDLAVLENKLINYLNEEKFENEFDINEVPIISNEEIKSLEYNQKINKTEVEEVKEEEPEVNKAQDLLKQQEYAQELSMIFSFGTLTKSSSVTYLTDKENEIVVSVVKHLFTDAKKLVLQFNIQNTLTTTKLENISVIVQPDNEGYQEESIIPLEELKPNQTGVSYVVFNFDETDIIAGFGNTLNYINKDVDEEGNADPNDDGWSDEYQIDDFEVLGGDFITGLYGNFEQIFEKIENSSTTAKVISGSSLEEVIEKIKNQLNMSFMDGSEFVSKDSNSHVLKLLGKDVYGGKIATLIKLAFTGGKIVGKIEVKTETKVFGQVVLDSIF
ncbi:unnamed protein product [Candida verbasci]|uniref:Coatomer subunit gamma n=1 Tax=Candida verbasci TaxID=1227364 RepID=A0A9W4TY96_9ASCO|nr:unnamed protein product [Candida verbasci]